MGVKLINRVKYSPSIYRLYFFLGNIIVNSLKLFIKVNPKRIFFISFGGRKFDDSPKVIFDEILKDKRFDDFELVWAFQNPEKFSLERGKKIKTDNLNYFKSLLSSGIWITNSGVERGLDFRLKKNFYLNTWHGTPIKKMGSDVSSLSTAFGNKSKDCKLDVMLAQGKYDAQIFSRVFNIPLEKFVISGLPRNDELIKGNNEENIDRLKKKLNIPKGKKIILYAPTYREYDKDEFKNCIISYPYNFEYWEKVLDKDYVLLVRAHYEVSKELAIKESSFIRDMSSYHSLNELMLISDILISDYSSIFFDYSLLDRPMLAFCYDFEKYSKFRGLYFDIRQQLNSYFLNEEELLKEIKNIDWSQRCETTKKFKSKFIEKFGKSTSDVLNLIYDKSKSLS